MARAECFAEGCMARTQFGFCVDKNNTFIRPMHRELPARIEFITGNLFRIRASANVNEFSARACETCLSMDIFEAQKLTPRTIRIILPDNGDTAIF
jgi:hypothetical protein